MADLSQYLDIPDAQLQALMPGVDIAALKESIRKSQEPKTTEANATPVTQTIKTNPETGEQTVTISGSAKDLSSANPLTPNITGPVIPGQGYLDLGNSASGQRVAYQPPRPEPTPVPATDYLRGIAQAESGNRPLGYHDPSKSSAYGTYGLTNAAYQDVQRADPRFANRPITELTPDQQTQAAGVYTGQNARYLQSMGVEPTEANLRLAHFLGAKGASDYLKTGAVSPAAAEANGGEQRVREIANARLNGPQGPVAPGRARPPIMIAGSASSDVGLTPTEQALKQTMAVAPTATPGANAVLGISSTSTTPTWQDDLAAAGNNATKLYAIAGNESYPKEVQLIAADRARQIYLNTKNKEEGAAVVQAAAEGDPQAATAMMKALRDKSGEGSWIRALILQGAGFSGAADRELKKLEGGALSKVIVGGKSYTVQTNPDGAVLKAWDAKGQAQDDVVLAKINAESTPQGAQAYGFTGGSMVIQSGPDKGQEYRQRTNSITGNIENVITTGPNAGKLYTGAPGIERSVGTAALKSDYALVNKYREKMGLGKIEALDQARKDGAVQTPEDQVRFLNAWDFSSNMPGGNITATPAVPVQATPAVPVQATPAVPVQATPVAPGATTTPPAAPAGGTATPATATAQTTTSASAAKSGYPIRGFNEPANVYKARLDAYLTKMKEVAKAEGKIIDKELQKEYYAREVFPMVNELKGLVAAGTGSGFGAGVDSTLGFFGLSTSGADAIAATAPLANQILMQVERFEGAQSDTDVKSYKEAAGKLADPTVPTSQKEAAFKTIIGIMKRNAPDLDWASVEYGDKNQSAVRQKADEIIQKGSKKK